MKKNIKKRTFDVYLSVRGVYDTPPIDISRRWYWMVWYWLKWFVTWKIRGILTLSAKTKCKIFGHKPVMLTNLLGEDVYTSDVCRRCGKEING